MYLISLRAREIFVLWTKGHRGRAYRVSADMVASKLEVTNEREGKRKKVPEFK